MPRADRQPRVLPTFVVRAGYSEVLRRSLRPVLGLECPMRCHTASLVQSLWGDHGAEGERLWQVSIGFLVSRLNVRQLISMRAASMGKLRRDAIEHFKEVFWAVFLLYLFLIALFFLFGRHVGFATMAWISFGFALLITIVFGSIFAINLICVIVIRAIRRFRGPKVLL
jgi:hypothetical protein